MNNNNIHWGRYLILFMPWLIASCVEVLPIWSYLIAWSGSFFIFFMTLTGKIKPIPDDRSPAEQLMRPLFLVQIIFAGYMCCTSIFYFFNALGYTYFDKSDSTYLIDPDALVYIARCQRYYCLAHAAFVSGILVAMKYPAKSPYFTQRRKLANLLLITSLISFPVSVLFLSIPGLSQFYYQLSSLSFIAGTLALAFAIPLQKFANTCVCLILYAFNFYQALISGFKEPIIISVMVLGVFLYPNYKKIVTVLFLPAIVILFIFLPTYVSNYRAKVWSGDETSDNASQEAVNAALNNDEVDQTNWDFLVYRLSEMDMFIDYVKSTPEHVDYYRFKLLEQSAEAIVPRVFWPSKPITEDLVMERVYAAGVVNENSSVSAKPAYVVDAYLTYGPLGIIVFLFAYGATAQWIAIKAEKMFGGYVLGTALIFTGLFQIFWRGLSFEFIVNTVFWSYITMLIVQKIMIANNVLELRYNDIGE